MEKLKQEYVEKARARPPPTRRSKRARRGSQSRGLADARGREASAAKAEALGVDDVLRASGADGDALEAMVREALRGSERRHGVRDDTANARSEETSVETSVPSIRAVDGDDEDGDAAASREAEIDPTRWATRIDSTVGQTTSTTVGQTTDAPRASSSSNDMRLDAKEKDLGAGDRRRRASAARPARAEKKRARRETRRSAGPTARRAGEPETASRGREVVEPEDHDQASITARARDAPRGVVRRDAGNGGGGGGGAARGVTRRFFSLLFTTSFSRSRCRHLPASART